MFYHALPQLHEIMLTYDSFTGLSATIVIGLSYYFGFGFMTLN